MRNFLAYRAPPPISFAGVELACLSGRNGVGKSALLDAITWALWGRARARRDDFLIHQGREDMSVALDFEQEGLRYRVQRRRSRAGAGSRGALDLWIMQGVHPRAIGERTMRRTQAKITEILRLDYETFAHSAFLQQGRADAFTLKTAAERKRILSDMLGLERWDGYAAATKSRLSARQAEIDMLAADIRALDKEIAAAPRLQAELDSAIEALDEAQAQLESVSAAYDEVAHAAAALRRDKESLREVDERIDSRQRDITAVSDEVARQQERIERCQDIIARQAEIQAGYAELQAARSSQSAVAEQLAQQQALDRRRHQLEADLAQIAADLQRKADILRERIRGLQEAQSAAADLDMPGLQRQLGALESMAQRRDQAAETLQSLRERRSSFAAQQTSLAQQGQELNQRLERLAQADGADCPLCGQALTAAHRDDMLGQLRSRRDAMREDYRRCMDGIRELEAQSQAHESDLADWARQLADLPALQQRMGAASQTIRRAEDAAAAMESEERALRQLEDRLRNDDYGEELRHQLAQLRDEQAGIAYDADSHADIRAKLQTFQRFDQQQTELDFAQRNLPEAQHAHAAASARLSSQQAALVQDQSRRETCLQSIAALEEQVKSERRLREEVDERRGIVQRLQERKTIAEQELNAIEMGRKNRQRLKTAREKRLGEAGLLRDLRQAFGRNGVPAMIIDCAIPELESAANDLLSRMSDGRMSLRLSTQRQGVGGDMQETLDIEIADELGARPYEMYSGGEAFRINFALRIALSRLLSRRAGAQLRTLFIDEGFGSQDEAGRSRLVDAINAIRGDIDLILVITHIDDLRDAFPMRLLVEKGRGWQQRQPGSNGPRSPRGRLGRGDPLGRPQTPSFPHRHGGRQRPAVRFSLRPLCLCGKITSEAKS